TWEVDDVIRVTIGQKVYNFTAGSTVITTILDNLVAAWNGLDATSFPEFSEITASRSASTLVLTNDVPGRTMTVTLTPLEVNFAPADLQTIEGVGVATTGTVATAASGPNDWSVAKNWSLGTVPATGDDVIIDIPIPIFYGLAQSAVTLASLTIAATFA